MSWWFYRKDKTGKRMLWALDICAIVPMIIVGFLFAAILPGLERDSIRFVTVLISLTGLTALCGFVCLLFSKLSLFRQGIWISHGTKQMSDRNARLYWAGYVLIIIGAFTSWLFSRLIP